MKRIAALITVAAALLTTGQIRAAAAAATPVGCIRNFYHWYVTNLVANRDPLKQRKEIRQYATERLLGEIGKMVKGPEGLDGDYFVDAQDFDPLWAKNISISDVKTVADKSSAHVLLNGSKGMQKKLLVHLLKEGGTWKVDKVQGRD
jgi:arginine/ornithine N-succinyltransferase beta subunit